MGRWHTVAVRGQLYCLLIAAAPAFALSASKVAAVEVSTAASTRSAVPDWVADAVFYQLFPERFCNGDPTNDPTWESLESPEKVPRSWAVSPWTGDWYQRAAWEREIGGDFYEKGVFDRRYGGDLQGVLDKLDYLDKLGINTIYFNPVFFGRSLHKYDGSSFHHVDPHFGPDPKGDFERMAKETSDPSTWQWTAADKLFLKVIQEAHRRKIRLIIDGVFNHTGRDFFAFADLTKNQEKSPYKSWYIVQQFDNPKTPASEFRYESWWGFESLPVFADTNDGKDLHPGPKKYVFDSTRRWMDPDGDGDPADGIDGWRLDVANEVPIKFWADWTRYVRRLNREAYTVSEVWGEASEFLRGGGFSATMNYHGFAYPVKGFLIDSKLSPTHFAHQLNERRGQHPERVQYALQNLIDGHDTDRVASMIVNAGRQDYQQADRFDYDVSGRVSPRQDGGYQIRKPNDRERKIQRLVAMFQMTYLGAPMIYYGTEAGMWGGDDPDDRMPMVWEDLEYEAQTGDPRGRQRPRDEVVFDNELYKYYRGLIRFRVARPSLCRGSFRVLSVHDDHRTISFARRCKEDLVVVALNRSEKEQTVDVPLKKLGQDVAQKLSKGFDSHGKMHDGPFDVDKNVLKVKLPPLTGLVLFGPR